MAKGNFAMVKVLLLVVSFFCLITIGGELPGDNWKASSLQAGDVLSISVFRVEEFSRTVRIEENGVFSYPLCGEIQAAGKTAREIGKELESRLSKQVADPHVDVFVTTWGPRRVYILGEVKSSQSMELPTYGRMTALQAISAAGGFTESADLNNVAVLRRDPKDAKVVVRHSIDVSALASRKSGGDDFLLCPEDTLIVPKAPPVFVTGSVGNPLTTYIDSQRPPLCSELVIRAGGMIEGADPGKIVVIRTEDNGKQLTIPASLKVLSAGKFENDVRVHPGDYVFVGAAEHIYVLGQVQKPGPLVLAPDKVVTASQAIALSGGFTPVAKESDITLIRDREIRSINLRKLYHSIENMERDIELKNGDILFVRESMW